ncbi:phosphatase PAP2 family protein [Sphingosinicella rhizophila]|uniref:Phosphatase PAP2 family protein n=1 Tax=Sphingosinicella rhizophila TaxID=3050082 RepID=A0ABU3Q838_9SPHN|nr:phosphatase PAP2 family protein [Sphingosinicella sp. GR2756]MDT9599254.1 phosphatase PAP2 family protein [Sphingosinicella sp. GR2756]
MAKGKADKASQALQRADRKVAEAVVPHRETPLVQAIDLFAKLADQPPLRVLCAAVIAAGLLGGDRRRVRAGVRMLAAHTVATWTKDAVKHRIDRTRPRSAVEKSRDHRLSAGRSESKEETSFPSGHSAGAAAVARGFAREYPELGLAAQIGGGALALAQIPRCAHYPTDIGAGLAIGIAAELAVDAAFRLLPGGSEVSSKDSTGTPPA